MLDVARWTIRLLLTENVKQIIQHPTANIQQAAKLRPCHPSVFDCTTQAQENDS